MASQQCKELDIKFKCRHEYSSDMGGFASSASEESSSGSDSDMGDTSDEWRCGGSDDGKWIMVREKNTYKTLKIKLAKNSIKMVTPNKYTAVATYIEETPSPPERSPNDDRTLTTWTRAKKRPTQKHICHTLRLLAQQESAFLERSNTGWKRDDRAWEERPNKQTTN